MDPRTAATSAAATAVLSLPGLFAGHPDAPPVRAVEAYLAAASSAPCHLDWRDLAAIGKVETGHGTFGGSVLDADGRTTRVIKSSAGARGPMQFMADTWAEYGQGDIDDIDDAARATAAKLCADGYPTDRLNAIGGYNGGGRWRQYGESLAYVKQVDAYAAGLPEVDPQQVGALSGAKDRSLGRLINRVWDKFVIRGWLAVPDRVLPRPAWEKVDTLAFGDDGPMAAERTPVFADSWSGPGLQPEFQRRLDAMFAAAPASITVYSGYRDPAHQKELWDASDKTGTWVAFSDGASCTSNHCKGLAADLAFADAATREWAHKHAAEFGLEAPMSWEPWHFQPVGA
jgi:hypothetical protein